MIRVPVDIKNNPYDVIIGKGLLSKAEENIDLNRKVLIVTDDGVPEEYSNQLCDKCAFSVKAVIKSGEESKTLSTFEKLLKIMLENQFSRKDAVVAVGGGVVGDISGFAASCYMRGIDFYNIPTTLLSQVDSSVGGKTAVNLENVKNIVGTFYQPKKVIIDIATLDTLPERQFVNGMAEVIKIAAVLDGDFFKYLEENDLKDNAEYIIYKSVSLKRDIVVKDEKEKNIRKVLNFGHTVGHGIELNTDLYHGESIGLGMLYMCSTDVKKRIEGLMQKTGLPLNYNFDIKKAAECIKRDKKGGNGKVTVVVCPEIGRYEFREVSFDNLLSEVK